jgi:ferredoxin
MTTTIHTEIFYFSGTGNSLHVARELAKRLPHSKITAIVSCMAENTCVSKAESVGLVFPVHALTIPIVMRLFLQKLTLDNARYVLAVATRQGTVFHGFRRIEDILKRKHLKLNAEFLVTMYGNDSRHRNFTTPSGEVLRHIESEAARDIEFVAGKVNTQLAFRTVDTRITVPTGNNKLGSWLTEKLVLACMDVAERLGGVNYFYHDTRCNGCGICARVCLSGKIRMTPDTPVWQKSQLCFMCFACLNFCPQESVQIKDIPGVKSHTISNGRYPHPYATVQAMEVQKASGGAPDPAME